MSVSKSRTIYPKLDKLMILFGSIVGVFLLLGFSFADDQIDLVFIFSLILLSCIYLFFKIKSATKRIVFIFACLFFGVIAYIGYEVLDTDNRTSYAWKKKDYVIELEHRLGIAGPGCYWFLKKRTYFAGNIERLVKENQYQAGLPDLPENFKFHANDNNLNVTCCSDSTFLILQNWIK